MRPDSRVAVAHGDDVVAVCYVTERNQHGLHGYGELHYAAVRDDHRGKGLWGAMITELFARSATWGVVGVIFVTDRTGPIEMYLRMGAQRIGIRPKPKHRPWWWRALRRVRDAVRR
jgi:GNAT superfamily N-acetyltransferase